MALRACCDDFIPTFVDKVTFTQLPDVHLANAKASHLLSTLDHTHTHSSFVHQSRDCPSSPDELVC
jgi:hypothetical protein